MGLFILCIYNKNQFLISMNVLTGLSHVHSAVETAVDGLGAHVVPAIDATHTIGREEKRFLDGHFVTTVSAKRHTDFSGISSLVSKDTVVGNTRGFITTEAIGVGDIVEYVIDGFGELKVKKMTKQRRIQSENYFAGIAVSSADVGDTVIIMVKGIAKVKVHVDMFPLVNNVHTATFAESLYTRKDASGVVCAAPAPSTGTLYIKIGFAISEDVIDGMCLAMINTM